ncbi:MAG: Rpp14/Pop5 family protein [Candidatus Micrarchaeota archaeon]
MVKAGSLRKRYILFEYKGAERDEESLKRAVYAEALRFFGELGLSYAALKLVSFDKKGKKGILRCERDHLDKVLGFLALIDSLDGSAARLIAVKSSGTLKALGKTEDSTQPR